uniref:Uncharacterized protein n=1 Tax=Octopus bimaculoides TaxID=37653 RepID=A0A0L8HAF5_OCTBM
MLVLIVFSSMFLLLLFILLLLLYSILLGLLFSVLISVIMVFSTLFLFGLLAVTFLLSVQELSDCVFSILLLFCHNTSLFLAVNFIALHRVCGVFGSVINFVLDIITCVSGN